MSRGRLKWKKKSFHRETRTTRFLPLYVPFSLFFSLSPFHPRNHFLSLSLSSTPVISGEIELVCFKNVFVGFPAVPVSRFVPARLSNALAGASRMHSRAYLDALGAGGFHRRDDDDSWVSHETRNTTRDKERARACFLSDYRASSLVRFPRVTLSSRENIRSPVSLFTFSCFFFSPPTKTRSRRAAKIYLRSASLRLHFRARIERARPLFPLK